MSEQVADEPEKQCPGCKRVMQFSDFNKCRRSRDGLTSRCKDCVKLQGRLTRARHLEKIRERDRVRNKKRKNRTDTKGGARRKEYNTIRDALRDGLLCKPLFCTRCWASGRIEAHHNDYSRPLDVVWLCPSCHASMHREERAYCGDVAKMQEQHRATA